MTREEAAAALNGNQYGEEGSPALFAAMRSAGLVAVFGASDDLIEFEGAIRDEGGAPGTVYLTRAGLLQSECEEGEDCPYYRRLLAGAATIKSVFDRDGFTFVYETAIPHVSFDVVEGGEPYCRGIVFALADVPGTAGEDVGAAKVPRDGEAQRPQTDLATAIRDRDALKAERDALREGLMPFARDGGRIHPDWQCQTFAGFSFGPSDLRRAHTLIGGEKP